MNKAVFIDKDGTLIPDIPYNVNPDLITLTDTAIPALYQLQQHQFSLILISNQSGVARGFFAEKDLDAVNKKLTNLLSEAGIAINGFYYCPHFENGTVKEYSIACDCRKPAPGLILQAANDFSIDLSKSWMIGDILNDVEAGRRAGCKTILINNGNETEWEINELRQPHYKVQNLFEAADIIANNA